MQPVEMADFKFNIIVANDLNRGIGLGGTLPWSLPTETNYYHGMINHVTAPGAMNACLFGRVTYESIHDPADYAKLLKVVVTTKKPAETNDPNLFFVNSFQEGVEYLKTQHTSRNLETIWILGGSGVYAEALKSPYLNRIYLTTVLKEFKCDTFFPEFDKNAYKIVTDDRVPKGTQTDKGVEYKIEVYERLQ